MFFFWFYVNFCLWNFPRYGDSEFRKASILLIVTWVPFPTFYALSPEGFGALANFVFLHHIFSVEPMCSPMFLFVTHGKPEILRETSFLDSGIITDVLFVQACCGVGSCGVRTAWVGAQVGWAFLNIVSKFTFIFYIQRIKDSSKLSEPRF